MKQPNFNEPFPMWVIGPFQSPSTFSALPDLKFPLQRQTALVEELKRALIRSSGLQPRAYSALDSTLFPAVKMVCDGLIDRLMDELSGVSTFELCTLLYARHEEYLGHILRGHHNLAALRELGYSHDSSINNQMLWEGLSNFTESIRWLIEIAVKYCATNGTRVEESKFDLLVELARTVYEWDMAWELVAHNVIPHELIIGHDFGATAQLTPKGIRAMNAYRSALMPGMAEAEQERFQMFQTSPNQLSIQELIDRIDLKELDEPLTRERGYSMSDWIKFSLGLIDSFSFKEYLRAPLKADLVADLSSKWELDPMSVDCLLRDYGLSFNLMNDIHIRQVLPVENARRDSRLIRRPVVSLESEGSERCLYGVETISIGLQMVLARIESGRIDFIHQDPKGLLRQVVGALQEQLGLPFEQEIADRCHELGFENKVRKENIKGQRPPQGEGFGPVDVFVVDRDLRRFILVEAKNVADEGLVPKIIMNEQEEFSEYIDKLQSQTSWFADHVADLMSEYGIAPEEHYSVEGVIVVSRPRPWMFSSDEPLPIFDFHGFFDLLRRGSKFVLLPVAV